MPKGYFQIYVWFIFTNIGLYTYFIYIWYAIEITLETKCYEGKCLQRPVLKSQACSSNPQLLPQPPGSTLLSSSKIHIFSFCRLSLANLSMSSDCGQTLPLHPISLFPFGLQPSFHIGNMDSCFSWRQCLSFNLLPCPCFVYVLGNLQCLSLPLSGRTVQNREWAPEDDWQERHVQSWLAHSFILVGDELLGTDGNANGFCS